MRKTFSSRHTMKRSLMSSILSPLSLSLLCLFFATKSFSNEILTYAPVEIKGTVTSTDGKAIEGATINEKSTKNTAVSKADGTYIIKVTDLNATLVVSHVGFVTKEVRVSANVPLDITLEAVNADLDQVVVIGYGTQRKRDLTGSVASVSGKQLAAVPVTNAAQALQGKLPGVNVTSQDGRPDASISIRVRGGGSISQSNDPLFIVDGFPVGSINDIPSNQIESIDVLKDASSTAIYGARGANGVIIITTKSGKAGKMSVQYNSYLQSNRPTKYLETMNAYDYIDYNWGYAKAISDAYANAWAMLWGIGTYNDTYNNHDGIDHYKIVEAISYARQAYKASNSQSHNISVSNGNNKTKYILSMSLDDNDGMKINSWFKRANASFKVDQKLSDKLTLSFDTRFTNIRRMGNEGTTNGKGSILSTSYQFRPIPTKEVRGQLDDTKNTQLGLYDLVLQDQYNPVALMRDYLPYSEDRSLRSNASLEWTPIKGLTARSEVGLNMYWNKGKTWTGSVYNNYLDIAGKPTYAGNASIASSEGWGLRWVNTLNYKTKVVNEHHQVNVTLGQEVNNSGSEGMSMWGNKYPASFSSARAFAMMNQYLQSTTTVNYGYSSNVGTPNRLLSYFGRLNYALNGKYLLTATLREDGSSRFAPTHRWGIFPAGAAAWRISDENFMKNISWIDNLKLKASYGSVGNDGISANLWKTSWTSDGLRQFSINEVQQSSYSPASTIANPNLKWETTITRNLGVDYSFFNNRLFGTVEVYKNSTKDLLMLTSISAISGFSATYDNIGSTSNKGIEFSMGGDFVRKKNVTLSGNFNINFNKGSVDALAPGVNGLYKTGWGSSMTQPNTGDYILQVGKPVGQVRGYTYQGWYSVDDFNYANGIYTLKTGVPDIGAGILGTVYGTTAYKAGGQSAYPGVIKFKDINGDGVVNESDVSIIGNMVPKHTGGFSLNGTVHQLDFALNFNWSYGNQVYNANYLAAFYGSKEDGLYRNRLDYLSTAFRIHQIVNGQLVMVNDPSTLRSLNANATTFLPYHENPVVSTLGIQDGSYLRLNTVTIGYNLNSSMLKTVKIQKMRLYGSIYNAFTWTKYKGLDPEVNTNMSQGGAQYPTLGLDWGSYPRARSFTVGVNVEF